LRLLDSAWNSRLHALWRWAATLVLLVLLQGCTTEYSAMPIEAWVMDAESSQPVQGVIVGASRGLKGGLAGGNQLDRMKVMEARSPIRRGNSAYLRGDPRKSLATPGFIRTRD
jgi:hypothetical protein